MSKLYDKYIKLKEKDNSYIYMFKSGMFYIFLEEDATTINEIFQFKITKLNDNVIKCGFPCNSYDKYLNLFNKLNLNIKIIEDNIVDFIKNIDIDNINGAQAINLLKKIKEEVI